MSTILSYIQKRFRFDLLTLLFSIFIGLAVWYYVETSRTEERELSAELVVRIPRGWEAQGLLPRARNVILRGPRNVIASLRPGDIRFRVVLDVDENASFRQDVHLELKSEDLKGLPEDVIVEQVIDPQLVIGLVRPVRKYIPIEVDFTGELPQGYVLGEVNYSPKYIPVYAPQEQFSKDNIVHTEPIDLTDRRSFFGAYVDLQVLKLKDINKYLPESVTVQVDIVAAPEKKIFRNVPVSLLLATRMENLAGGKLIPPQVSIEVEGDKVTLDSMEAKAFTIYIDTRDMGSSVQGEYLLKCRSLAPAGVVINNIIPNKIRWLISKPELAAQGKSEAQK